MGKRRSGRLIAAAAVVAAIGGGAGGAFAYFSSPGGGSASKTVVSAAALEISPGTPGAQLAPGGSSDVAVEISNPNPFRVRVHSLVLDVAHGGDGFGVDDAHRSNGCTAASAALAFATQAIDRFVPPKVGDVDGHLSIDLPDAVSMGAASANACQGATFTVFLRTGV